MLNVGQVVYDYTNSRVIIFAGLSMFQNQETDECHSESGFILKDGTFIHLKAEKDPFSYTNLNVGGKAYIGSFVVKCRCGGHYFGIIDGHGAEVKVWAKEAIEEVEALIAKHGLNVTEETSYDRKYSRYHIGKPAGYKPKMVISAPKANKEVPHNVKRRTSSL